MLYMKWAVALPFFANVMVQAFVLDSDVGNGVYTFEEQVDGSFLTKRELAVEESFAFNKTVSLKYAKRDEKRDGGLKEDEGVDSPQADKEPKVPDPPLKNYPFDWETVPLPQAKDLGCPERRQKIRRSDYKEATEMLAHFCKYYYIQKRSNAAFVSGGAIVYVCNSQKKGGICSIGEYTSAENDMNKECLFDYPAWARYDKKLGKIYGRDVIGSPFCHSDEQVLKYDLHKPNNNWKGKKGN